MPFAINQIQKNYEDTQNGKVVEPTYHRYHRCQQVEKETTTSEFQILAVFENYFVTVCNYTQATKFYLSNANLLYFVVTVLQTFVLL